MFLKNSWYAAGWQQDFPADSLRAVTIIGEPLVFYRLTDGSLVAKEDMCAHRLAPLSLGRLEGDNLRCMYHGLLYAPDGRCVEIPGQAKIPPNYRVRVYPVIEKHCMVWVWMGDPARADESFIPNFQGHAHPDWALRAGRMDYKANYNLVIDNLLDLSHSAWLHANSFGGGEQSANDDWGGAPVRITGLDRGVRVARWVLNTAGSPFTRVITGPLTDQYITYDFIVPGIFILHHLNYKVGTAEACGLGVPDPSIETVARIFSCQVVTPVSERDSVYYFAFGPEKKFAMHEPDFCDIKDMAFGEDKVIIEAQQRIVDANPLARPRPLAADSGITRFHRIMDKLMHEDSVTTPVGATA